jgi:hypothetical protein
MDFAYHAAVQNTGFVLKTRLPNKNPQCFRAPFKDYGPCMYVCIYGQYVYEHMSRGTVFVIQASMRYEPSRTGNPPSLDECLTAEMQSEFTTHNQVRIDNQGQGIQTSPTAPGRLIVIGTSPHLSELGDMTSAPSSAVQSMSLYAASRSSPFMDYLRICSKHGLCLNKYLTPLE